MFIINNNIIKKNTEKIIVLEQKMKELKEVVMETIKKREHLENKIDQQKIKMIQYKKINDDLRSELHIILRICKSARTTSEILKKIVRERGKKIEKIESGIETVHKEHDEYLKDQNTFLKTTLQEQKVLTEKIHSQTLKLHKSATKYYLTAALSAIIIAAIFAAYSNFLIEGISGKEYQILGIDSIGSGYVIENLKGDAIDTWLSWHLVKGDVLHVNIVNADKHPSEKIAAIKNVITSQETIEIDDSLLHKGPKGSKSLYYLGWSGALDAASQTSTKYVIPTKFVVIEEPRGVGDITIFLTNLQSGDGYSGFTKSIADETRHQILKSQITIYETDNLSDGQLEAIFRHEFGHALGLAHSTAPEDLMYPEIRTAYPYISECDLDAITFLYDGGQSSQVICEK